MAKKNQKGKGTSASAMPNPFKPGGSASTLQKASASTPPIVNPFINFVGKPMPPLASTGKAPDALVFGSTASDPHAHASVAGDEQTKAQALAIVNKAFLRDLSAFVEGAQPGSATASDTGAGTGADASSAQVDPSVDLSSCMCDYVIAADDIINHNPTNTRASPLKTRIAPPTVRLRLHQCHARRSCAGYARELSPYSKHLPVSKPLLIVPFSRSSGSAASLSFSFSLSLSLSLVCGGGGGGGGVCVCGWGDSAGGCVL